jgi:hypothetical protein
MVVRQGRGVARGASPLSRSKAFARGLAGLSRAQRRSPPSYRGWHKNRATLSDANSKHDKLTIPNPNPNTPPTLGIGHAPLFGPPGQTGMTQV